MTNLLTKRKVTNTFITRYCCVTGLKAKITSSVGASFQTNVLQTPEFIELLPFLYKFINPTEI